MCIIFFFCFSLVEYVPNVFAVKRKTETESDCVCPNARENKYCAENAFSPNIKLKYTADIVKGDGCNSN